MFQNINTKTLYICFNNSLYVFQGLAMAAVRFRFDGQAINESDTPLSLEMEEGDTIEVYQQQTGGGYQYCVPFL